MPSHDITTPQQKRFAAAALAMLDHVMLWVARILAAVLLGEVLTVVYQFFVPDAYLLQTMARNHRVYHWWHIQNWEAARMLLFLLTVTSLWNLSLWWLRKDAGRLYLFLSGALMFAGYAYQLLDLLVAHPRLPTGQEWLLQVVAPTLGFFAVAWTGFRAPGLPPMKWIPTISIRANKTRQQLPPTSTNLFRSLTPSF